MFLSYQYLEEKKKNQGSLAGVPIHLILFSLTNAADSVCWRIFFKRSLAVSTLRSNLILNAH